MGCCAPAPERAAEIPEWAAEVRRDDLDFWMPTLFVPDQERPAFWALAAFGLELARVRGRAREPIAARIRYQWWRDAALSGEPAGLPAIAVLRWAIAAYGLSREALDGMIAAREFEIDAPPPVSGRELADRAEASLAPLVLAGLAVLGARDVASEEAGRLIARAAGVARGEVRGPFADETIRDATGEAREALERARALRSRVPRAARPALLLGVAAGLRLKALARAPLAAYPAAARASRPARAFRVTWAAALGRY